MKISIKEATKKILFENPDIKNINEIVKKIKELSKTSWNKKRIKTDFEKRLNKDPEYSNYVIKTDDTICSRYKLFENTKFKIKLTNDEFNEKRLYIGHRFIPFIDNNFFPKEIILLDENDKKIVQKKELLDFFVAHKYISFFNAHYISAIEEFEHDKINLTYFDLSSWFKNNSFKINDFIEITVLDILNKKYKISKISKKEYNRNKLLIKNKDKELEENISKVIIVENLEEISTTLFKAFAESSKDLIKESGSPIAMLINESENFSVNESSGSPILLDKDKSLFDYLDNLNHAPIEHGKAKSLEGILKELGNGFSINFIQSLAILQLNNKGQVVDDDIFNIIFRKGTPEFYNKKQLANFQYAYSKLIDSTIKIWFNIKLDKYFIDLMDMLTKIQIKVNLLLRKIDDHLNETGEENFDFSFLDNIQPIDLTAEEILFQLVNSKGNLPTMEVKGLNDQIKMIYQNINDEIDEIIENI